jgi:peptidyl-prolyl cis-trans isomerase A (cyclophilin A)
MRRVLPALLALSLSACGEEASTPGEGEVEKTVVSGDQKAPPTKPADGEGGATAPEKAKADGPPPPTPLPEGANPALTNPALAAETAPGSYTCAFETTKGSFVVQVTREWAPMGADRFYNLCKIGYFDNARFFRNIQGFMVQFGVSAYPAATTVWKDATIDDDPVVQSNKPLYVTFAKTGAPNSRSTQIFVNHGDNANLDAMGFAPFGQVVEGADVVGQLFAGYGEGAPRGRGPNQAILSEFGEVYLGEAFPKLDTIKKTTVK